MRTRRVIGTAALAAAGVALAPALLAPPAGAAPSAGSARPSHVAILVAGDRTACVPWHRGMTGDDVLSAGHFELTTNTSGLITQIDGRPAHPDPYRSYWAYFTDTGTGWRYNGLGPSGTHPPAGSVEGWNYEPADAQEHVPPPAASYAQICAGRDRPAPPIPASNPPAHPARAAGAAAPRASSPASSTRSTRPTEAPAGSRVGTTPPATPTPDHRTAGARSPDGPGAARRASDTAGPSVPATAPSPRLSPVSAGGGSGPSALPTVGTAAAILVVLALVGSGLWRARRRGRS